MHVTRKRTDETILGQRALCESGASNLLDENHSVEGFVHVDVVGHTGNVLESLRADVSAEETEKQG